MWSHRTEKMLCGKQTRWQGWLQANLMDACRILMKWCMSSACGVRLCVFCNNLGYHVNMMGYWRENICDQPMTDTEVASVILCNSITISIQWWRKLLKVNKHLCEAPLLFKSVHTSYIYIHQINQFIIGLMDHRLKSLKYLNLRLVDMDQKSYLGIFMLNGDIWFISQYVLWFSIRIKRAKFYFLYLFIYLFFISHPAQSCQGELPEKVNRGCWAFLLLFNTQTQTLNKCLTLIIHRLTCGWTSS